MKRWIVAVLITLAVVVLISPGIVGMLAERNLEATIDRAEQENPDLVVTRETFERGWFTAAGRYRIELANGIPGLRPPDDAGAADSDRKIALIIDTRIDHGLLPLTSMTRDSGSLRPALASSVSTLHLDTGEGAPIELPGKLFTTIGLTGTTASRYELEAGTYRDDDINMQWDGAHLRFAIDASASALHYDGHIEPLLLHLGGVKSTFGPVRFEGQQEKTEYGFSVGDVALKMQAASFDAPQGGTRGFTRLTLDAHSELADSRVNGNSSLDIEDLSIPGLGNVDLGLEVAASQLDARALHRIIEGLQSIRAGQDPSVPWSDAYPAMETDLETFLQQGGQLVVDRFSMTLPQGEVTARLRFDLPETGRRAQFSWPATLLALTASADVRVPGALIEGARDNPQVAGLVAGGFLKRDGDAYVLKAEYAQGLVTVNGAPMPIPLGTLPGRDPGH